MLPYDEEEMPLKWMFQQDNDPEHTSKQAAFWFQTNKIKGMERLAQSLDFNSIENVFILGWNTCLPEVDQKLVNSIRQR